MEQTPKQQIVERIKQANNILVTVSADPTVDQLAACIGLTLLLNGIDKHGTAVFSGKVPSTLEFLQPEKTIETNTDSLRDFIISLDRAKADKLRYKVEDQVVRIFITPYRTSLGEQDLIFSQGDFNVEVVIALGVKDREHVDAAITAHGRILHDATVISLNAGPGEPTTVGTINWQEETASSLCEMLVSISESFGSGLIDNQMATAFLTGIVAETERFSNPKTTPKVMTMSAQLMAAGANQQLIAAKLAEPEPEPTPEPDVNLQQDNVEVPTDGQPEAEKDKADQSDGTLVIDHDDHPEPAQPQQPDQPEDEIHIDEHGNFKLLSDQELEAEKSIDEAMRKSKHVIEPINQAPRVEPQTDLSKLQFDEQGNLKTEPSHGGTLTANTKPEELSGTSDPMSQPTLEGPMLERAQPAEPATMPDQGLVLPAVPSQPEMPPAAPVGQAQESQGPQPVDPTLADIAAQLTDAAAHNPSGNLDQARSAVEAAAGSGFDPSRPQPLQSVNSQVLQENLNANPFESAAAAEAASEATSLDALLAQNSTVPAMPPNPLENQAVPQPPPQPSASEPVVGSVTGYEAAPSEPAVQPVTPPGTLPGVTPPPVPPPLTMPPNNPFLNPQDPSQNGQQ